MYYLLVALHIIVCLFMVLVVLLQTGKGAEMGAAFGGSAQTMFGSRGAATFLSKLTTTSAVVFMLTSFALAFMASRTATIIPEKQAPAAVEEQAAPPTDTGGVPAESAAPVDTSTPAPSSQAPPVDTSAPAPASPAPAAPAEESK